MSIDNIDENTTMNATSSTVDQEKVNEILANPELMKKILAEQGVELNESANDPKQRTKDMRKQALSVTITILSMVVLGIFLL